MDTMSALYTRRQWDLLPEGFPAQLIEGRLVREPSPAFGHQRIALAIAHDLKRLVGPRRVGLAPVDVPVDAFNVFQPDVVVWRAPLADDTPYDEAGIPLLVVEVLSPSTARRDRAVKRVRLLDAGVDEVWLVDRQARTIEVYDRDRYRDQPRRVVAQRGSDELASERLASERLALASRALEGFELSPAQLFGA